MNKMKQNKLLKGILIAGMVLIMLVSVIEYVTQGLIVSMIDKVVDISNSCEIVPYDVNCECETNQRKIFIPWMGIPRWNCENLDDLIIDPDSPTFEEDAIDFVQKYLEKHCGDVCMDLNCGENYRCSDKGRPNPDEPFCIATAYGYGSEGERTANVECRETMSWSTHRNCTTTLDCDNWEICHASLCLRQQSGRAWWGMRFFVESKTDTPKAYPFFNNYCYNQKNDSMKCIPPLNIVEY